MCGVEYDEPWYCDECIEKLYENPQEKLCKECYEYGKENAGSLIREHWAWGSDLAPFFDKSKKEFLENLDKMKPVR